MLYLYVIITRCFIFSKKIHEEHMNPPLNTDLVDKAIILATKAHGGTQRRGKGFPYIIHPLEALAIVATMTNDAEMLAAAVLHDCIEDTDITFSDIERDFGERVARLVMSETDVEESVSGRPLTWQERKLRDMVKLSVAPRDEKIVAMGDKLSNMRAIARDYAEKGDEVWQIFCVKDKATHAWRYKGLRDAFAELSDTSAFREFDMLVRRIFGD